MATHRQPVGGKGLVREQFKTMLRLPEDLHAALKVAAESNKRSVNAEIVARLEVSLSLEAPQRELADLVHEIRETLEYLRRQEQHIGVLLSSRAARLLNRNAKGSEADQASPFDDDDK